jgi:hypothetical protein
MLHVGTSSLPLLLLLLLLQSPTPSRRGIRTRT